MEQGNVKTFPCFYLRRASREVSSSLLGSKKKYFKGNADTTLERVGIAAAVAPSTATSAATSVAVIV